VSTQNLRPLWDRRILAIIIAVLTTAGALWLNIADYENFLDLIGAVFVPLSAVLITDYFVISRGRWDLSARAGTRWRMLVPWAAGFILYQLINPGYISWWVSGWTWIGAHIGFTVQSWMSASILSFAAAAVITALTGWPATRRPPAS
jgi:nucleobase:cation symporter-1, NCS1 family